MARPTWCASSTERRKPGECAGAAARQACRCSSQQKKTFSLHPEVAPQFPA
jgi:hypothetical protein